MNIAIFSPRKDSYSETFIKAHKKRLKGNIFFYFGGYIPIYLTSENNKLNNSVFRFFYRLIGFFKGIELYDYQRALLWSLKQKNVNVLLVEYGITAAHSFYAISQTKIPLIVHFHGYDAFRYDIVTKYKQKYKEVFEYAEFIISVSTYMSKQLVGLGCPPHKIILNPCGPNNLFQVERRSPTKKIKFVSVGRFCAKKFPMATIQAFAQVCKTYPDAVLTMIGEGDLLIESIEFAKALNISKNVIFPGVLTPWEIRNEFSESLAYVQHSIRDEKGDAEGTPVSVLEASLSGLPVVATKHSGIADVIEHNKTGLLCEERDVDQMAKHMIYLCENKKVAFKMGQAGRHYVNKNFSIDTHINILQKIINLIGKEAI